jgi:hypothetical protein
MIERRNSKWHSYFEQESTCNTLVAHSIIQAPSHSDTKGSNTLLVQLDCQYIAIPLT